MTWLFGLPGVRVQRVDREEYGGRVVHVETVRTRPLRAVRGAGLCPTR